MEYFAARNALDIESIGGVVAEALCDSGLIREPLDLFDLTLDEVASLNLGTAEEPRVFGPKNAAKVLSALEAARTKPLGNWLEAMGIPDVGAATAFQLGRIHKDLAEVANSPSLKALLDLLDYQNGIAPHRVDAALPPEDLFDLRKPVGLDDLVPQLKRAGLIKKSSATFSRLHCTCFEHLPQLHYASPPDSGYFWSIHSPSAVRPYSVPVLITHAILPSARTVPSA